MRQHFTHLVVTGLIIFSSCKGQSTKLNFKPFSVDSIPQLQKFLTLSPDELKMQESDAGMNEVLDSIMASDTTNLAKEYLVKKDFKNNRARVFLKTLTNGKIEKADDAVLNGLSSSCDCEQNGDTIFVQMNVGFFGGAGIKLQVTNDKFHSSYFTYIDHVKPFKVRPSDKEFVGYVSVPNAEHSLTLDQKPTFSLGQQITGYLTFTSSRYYEQVGDDLKEEYVEGNLYFTCKTKKKVPTE
jgi:hypothetical protein